MKKTPRPRAELSNVTTKDHDDVTADDVRAALVRYDVAFASGACISKVLQAHREWQLAVCAFNAAK